jgi:hypothetical protein
MAKKEEPAKQFVHLQRHETIFETGQERSRRQVTHKYAGTQGTPGINTWPDAERNPPAKKCRHGEVSTAQPVHCQHGDMLQAGSR